MLRMPLSARHKTRRRLGGLAMAAALGLGLAGATVIEAPAMAQSKKAQNSKGFAKAYEPVAAIVNAEGGDYAAAKAQLPALIGAIETPDDRFLAGNLTLLLGNKLKDSVLQRQGLQLMLDSGKTDPAQVGQFNFFVGSLAYEAGDYAAARAALQAAVAAGYTQDNPEGLIAESYFKEGQSAQGLQYLKDLIEQRVAAGQTVPDSWLLRGLKVAYDSKLNDQATEWSALLVAHSPTEQNWLQALQVINAVNALEPRVELDLLRLMALTNSLKERREFVSYIEAADPRIMANEVARVLDTGVQKGVFSSSDEYYADVKRVVDQRAAQDRAEAPQLAKEARASATGKDAQSAGDVYLSLGSYAEAEEMYALALEKGGVDRDEMLTRLGIVQVHQGKLDEARATFGQVSGAPRTAVARMWTAYIESRA